MSSISDILLLAVEEYLFLLDTYLEIHATIDLKQSLNIHDT
jgi:hypothetical protein